MSHFDAVPLEILDIILHHLGLDDFIKCRLVSKKWKLFVDTLLQTEGIWHHLCQNQLPDHGKSMMKKSELPWRDICRNVCLWRNIAKAITKPSRVPILQATRLLDFHVYKGYLIRVSETSVTYHKIPDFALVRDLNIKCQDFDETDFMFLMYDEHHKIHLYGKSHRDETFLTNTMIKYASDKAIARYVLQDDYCVMISFTGVLSECKWHKDHFQSNFLAKWFGPIVGVLDLVVLDDDILLVLVNRRVLKLDREARQLYVVNAVLAPEHPRSSLEDSTQKEARFYITRKEKRSFNTISPQSTTLTSQVSLAFSRQVTGDGLRCSSSDVTSTLAPEIEHVIPNVKYLNTRINQLYLQHGEMLICGFKDEVSFYAKKKVKKGIFKPEHRIVFNYDRTEGNGGFFSTGLVKIDVYESKDQHYLFVRNSNDLFIITFSYPSDLKMGLPGKLEDDSTQDEIDCASGSFESLP